MSGQEEVSHAVRPPQAASAEIFVTALFDLLAWSSPSPSASSSAIESQSSTSSSSHSPVLRLIIHVLYEHRRSLYPSPPIMDYAAVATDSRFEDVDSTLR